MAAAETELLLLFNSNSLMTMARTGILTTKANGTQLGRAQPTDQELRELSRLNLQCTETLSE
jgi:hypothetical protein